VESKWALMAGHGVTPNPLPSRLIARRLASATAPRHYFSVWATACKSETAEQSVSRSAKDSTILRAGALGKGRREPGDQAQREVW